MAYDEKLGARIRAELIRRNDVTERQMMGGLVFLIGGHMAVGVVRDLLWLRLGPEGTAAALKKPHTRVMDFTGRVSANMVYVAPSGIKTAARLRGWIAQAEAFAETAPPKAAKTATPRKPPKTTARTPAARRR